MERPGLLLLPPLDLPTHPYAAVPQLVTWLRRRGYRAEGLDLNLEFTRWVAGEADRHFGAAASILDGLEGETSRQGGAAGSGALAERLREAFSHLEGSTSRDPWKAPAGSRLRTAWALMALAFAPWEGEAPLWESHSVQYEGRGDPYSSKSLLRALERESLFDLFYASFFASRDLDAYGYAGISIPFASQVEPALRLARALRSRRPALPLLLGGPAASMQLAGSRDEGLLSLFDGIVVGPGERPLEELAERLRAGRSDLAGIPGLVHRSGGTILRATAAEPIPLEDLPLPEAVFDRPAYLTDGMVHPIRIRFSQGCSWKRCAFCNIPGHRELFPFQRPDEETMFRKVEALARQGEEVVYLADDEADPDMLERFSRWLLERRIRLRWTTNLRLSAKLTMEWATTLFEAGCRGPAVGVETLNDRLLALMRKGTRLSLIDRCLENLAWGSLPVMAYVMVGLPTETEEEARDSFERLERFVAEGKVDRAIYSLYGISPGSPVALDPAAYGITAVRPPVEADLNPYVFDFDHAGMPRWRAAELRRDFSARLEEARRRRAVSTASATGPPEPGRPEERLRKGTGAAIPAWSS